MRAATHNKLGEKVKKLVTAIEQERVDVRK